MKTIIAGTRTLTDFDITLAAIEASDFDITEVVSGMASGPDTHGVRYAQANGIPVKRFPANWREYGRSAGPRRNEAMAKYADALILVWDGESRGSRNMLLHARAAGLKVFVYRVGDGKEVDKSPI